MSRRRARPAAGGGARLVARGGTLLLLLLALAGATACGGSGDGERDRPEQEPRAGQPNRRDSSAEGGGPSTARDAGSPAVPVPAEARRTTVRGVTDGDTVDLGGLGSSRLIGVDAPEVSNRAECYGQESSSFTEEALFPGTSVRYVRGEEPVDRYGRDLVYLWLPDGRFLNGLLVRRGLAVPLAIPPNTEHADLFRRLAAAARARDRGLWAESACGGAAAARTAGQDAPAGGAPPSSGGGRGDFCDPSYPDACIPPAPPDLDCADVDASGFKVRGPDPHRFDEDGDGVACEG